MTLNDENDFKKAFSYTKTQEGGGYEIAKINGQDVGAISFILKKI